MVRLHFIGAYVAAIAAGSIRDNGTVYRAGETTLVDLRTASVTSASIAGLPGSKARVKVGPPLFCKGPSFGSTLVWLPVVVPVMVVPLLLPIRL